LVCVHFDYYCGIRDYSLVFVHILSRSLSKNPVCCIFTHPCDILFYIGDFILDPETIAFNEVVYFSMLFLVGFSILANFLCVLSEFLLSFGNDGLTFGALLEGTPLMTLPKESEEQGSHG